MNAYFYPVGHQAYNYKASDISKETHAYRVRSQNLPDLYINNKLTSLVKT